MTIAERYRDVAPLLADMALDPPTDSVDGVLAADGSGEESSRCRPSTPRKVSMACGVRTLGRGRAVSLDVQRERRAGLEEERRLMYVALTRAKDLLYLTYPMEMHERGVGMLMAKPSRFVEDIGAELLEPIAEVDEA